MTALYLYTLIVSLIVPLLYSIIFIDYIKRWKNFIVSTTIIASIYLIWDVIFTHIGVWGFNHDYCIDIYILKLPIEEILFFFVIPFCSLFTHYAFYSIFPNLKLKLSIARLLALLILLTSIILILSNLTKAYTVVNFIFLLIIVLIGMKYNFKLLQQFFITFLIVLIPFFIVNGILTGAITDAPIVWYDNTQNLGIRIMTIPIEDIGYAFSMLFGNLMIFEYLNNRQK